MTNCRLFFPSSDPDVGRQISDHQSNRGRGGQGQETGGKIWRLGQKIQGNIYYTNV